MAGQACRRGAGCVRAIADCRSWILRIPDGYDNRRQYKLIFGFHWLGGTATDVATGQTVRRDVWSYCGLRRLANNSDTGKPAPFTLNGAACTTG